MYIYVCIYMYVYIDNAYRILLKILFRYCPILGLFSNLVSLIYLKIVFRIFKNY